MHQNSQATVSAVAQRLGRGSGFNDYKINCWADGAVTLTSYI